MQLKNQCFLALDSACGSGSVAVFAAGECRAFKTISGQGQQATQLIPMVEAALGQAGLDYKSLHAIVCTVGPGSFTGIRIALSAANALGFALAIPVVGVTTLACIAHGRAPVEVFVNAGKGEVYAQFFDAHMQGGEIVFKPAVATPDLPDARRAGEVLMEYPALACAPVALYIRPPDAKLPTQGEQGAV